MELQIKRSDVERLLDIILNIKDNLNNESIVKNEIEKLKEFPQPIVDEFVNCITTFINNNFEITKDNYLGVVGYMLLRLNLKMEE
jgi:hypothetical protein